MTEINKLIKELGNREIKVNYVVVQVLMNYALSRINEIRQGGSPEKLPQNLAEFAFLENTLMLLLDACNQSGVSNEELVDGNELLQQLEKDYINRVIKNN